MIRGEVRDKTQQLCYAAVIEENQVLCDDGRDEEDPTVRWVEKRKTDGVVGGGGGVVYA